MQLCMMQDLVSINCTDIAQILNRAPARRDQGDAKVYLACACTEYQLERYAVPSRRARTVEWVAVEIDAPASCKQGPRVIQQELAPHTRFARTAFSVRYTFLGVNGWEIEAPETEIVNLMLDVADHRCDEMELATWLRLHVAPFAD